MAIVTVKLTDDSLAHLSRIMDAVVEITDPAGAGNHDGINRNHGAAKDIDFRPLITILHRMVVGIKPTVTEAGDGTITIVVAAPTAGTETALFTQLEDMLVACNNSIYTTNDKANYELVLKV